MIKTVINSLIAVLISIALIYDVFMYFWQQDSQHTISWIFRQACLEEPAVPFAVGFFLGHILWGLK